MLVTMAEVLERAYEGNYGVTAPNIQNENMARSVINVAEELNAPMIVDINAWVHPDIPWLVGFVRDLAYRASVPVAINLDHGKTYEQVMLGIRSGFTSVMVDRSDMAYEDNVRETKEVVKMCTPLGISVEAELGHVGQGDNYDVDG
ncbi:MAG TPA: class II fructose-bisphosphate aldolase, partial [Atopobiaceae bacterium]|nr:class II fructose-bisphosphate aldolase [Atopobiaceae bacterium]